MKRLFSLVKVMLKSSIQSMSSLDGMRIKKTDSDIIEDTTEELNVTDASNNNSKEAE